MKQNRNLQQFLLLILMIFMSSCASLTGFETGKTSGKNNGSFLISINGTQTPDFDPDGTGESNPFFFPNIEIGGWYGLAEKIDISLRMNTNLNVIVNGKFQILGDQDSKSAIALGAGIGNVFILSPLWYVQVPVYLSLHPAPNFAVYANPRFVYQFSVTSDINEQVSYLGGNVGILIGKKVKFGIDAGYFNGDYTFIDGNSSNIFTFGVGTRFDF